MKHLLAFAIAIFATSIFAAPRTWSTDLDKALAQAKKENKMAFILLGRENCGNCRATRKLVNDGEVPISAEKFVIADIDTDNPSADANFLRKFGRDNFGDTLPFVVITDSSGNALAKYSGYKSKSEVTAMIRKASGEASAAVRK